jgi:DNA-binding transcriptional MerR regulator
MLIGELENLSGLSRHTLRYYEREGLLLGVQRSSNGYRIYPKNAVQQVGLLKGLKALGFGLDEIKPILAAIGNSSINCADGANLLAQKRVVIQDQIRNLQSVNRNLLKEQKKLERRAAEHGVTPNIAAKIKNGQSA